jgi:hypothetical protein
MRSADERNIGSRRSPLARLVFSPSGEIRTIPLVAITVAALAALAAGMFIGLVAAGTGSPEVLGAWVAIGFFAIKLPLLGLFWYLLGRSGESTVDPVWSVEEASGILDYLEREASRAERRRDSRERLGYFAEEAWFVADRAPDALRGRAADLAVRIQGMAERAEARAGLSAPPERAG